MEGVPPEAIRGYEAVHAPPQRVHLEMIAYGRGSRKWRSCFSFWARI